MSHSTGFGVQVSAAELDRRRAVAEGQGRCAELRRRALEAADRAVRSGAEFIEVPEAPAIDARASQAAADAAVSRYESTVQRALDAVSAARTRAVLTALDAQAPPDIAGTISLAWKPRTAPAVQVTAPADTALSSADQTARARTMIASLAELDDEQHRGELARQITAALERPDTARRLSAIYSDIDRSYRDQARIEAIRREASEIVVTMSSYDSPAITRARDALVSATTRDELKAAAKLASAARDEARAHEQEEYVVEQTAAVLRELGYDVGGDFVETAEHGDFAVAANDQLGDYGIQVRLIDGGKRLITNTVALDAHTTHAADVAAEQHVCSDLAIVAERLGKRGVRLDQYFASTPGDMPIERRLDARSDAAARTIRRRRASGAKEAAQ